MTHRCWPLPTAKRAIIVAGCFGMAYAQLTTSPATIEFARALGGDGWHAGLLGALPSAMLVFQFLAAVAANHLRFRRPTWLWLSLVQRLVLVPVGLGPWLFPELGSSIWLWVLIASTAVNHALSHFCSPLWLSWMGDYLPPQGLSRYWGIRHLWMHWSAAVAVFGCSLFLFKSGWDMPAAFAAITAVSAVLGVIDILLFLKVDEPPVTPAAELDLRAVLAAPFRHGGFRTFIGYSCFWHFAAMLGAPFISIYLLEIVGMDLYRVMLLSTLSWVGAAALSTQMGDWAEDFGNRPVLVACTALKGVLMFALIVTPPWPTLVFWVMVPIFMLDAALNAGIGIATNGFLLKYSPAENRTMYIAAGTALAGLVGGVTSVAAGALVSWMGSWRADWGLWTFGSFHLVFFVSLVLRFVALGHTRRIHEPEAQGTKQMFVSLVRFRQAVRRPWTSAQPEKTQGGVTSGL
jgi:MFS family permease